jgi:hypothetical protein
MIDLLYKNMTYDVSQKGDLSTLPVAFHTTSEFLNFSLTF